MNGNPKGTNEITEIGAIRSLLADIKNAESRKHFKTSFHVLYCLVTALVLYLTIDSRSLGFSALPTLIGVFLFSAMSVFTNGYSPVFCKVIAFFSGPLIYAARHLSLSDLSYEAAALDATLLLCCVLLSAVFTLGIALGKTKLWIFTAASICFGIFILLSVYISASITYDSISPSVLIKAVDGYFEEFSKEYTLAVEEALSDEQSFEAIKQLLSPGADASAEELISAAKQTVEAAVSLSKPLVPSALCLMCMLLSFIALLFLSAITRIFRINVFVCIMDTRWKYRLPLIGYRVYDILLFIYIVGLFVALPSNIAATVVNLLLILTPFVFCRGISAIYSFFRSKDIPGPVCVMATGAIVVVSLMFVGIYSAFIIGSVGVFHASGKEKEERLLLFSKMQEENEYIDRIRKKNESSEKEDAAEQDSYNSENKD